MDRLALREVGLVSAPAWRSYLRLAYLWDDVKRKSGGRRVFATRPEVKRVAGPGSGIVDAYGRPVLRKDGSRDSPRDLPSEAAGEAITAPTAPLREPNAGSIVTGMRGFTVVLVHHPPNYLHFSLLQPFG